MAGPRDIAELEERLGYDFGDRGELERALTHRSFANEHRRGEVADNEKLEFLGDAVLDLVVSHALMRRFPDHAEGALTVARAQIVSEVGLSAAARRLGLGDWLRLGKGEARSGGRDKASILADGFEAVVAAVFVDGGFDAARSLAERLLATEIDGAELDQVVDHKTTLQERVQASHKATPEYRVMSQSGPDHAKRFEVAVFVAGQEWARATGTSKKSAEQLAAAAAVRRPTD